MTNPVAEKIRDDAVTALRALLRHIEIGDLSFELRDPDPSGERPKAYADAVQASQDVLTRVDNLEGNRERIVSCRSCGAPMVFLKTEAGKSNPACAERVRPGDGVFIWGHHISHFSNCPAANQHRGKR